MLDLEDDGFFTVRVTTEDEAGEKKSALKRVDALLANNLLVDLDERMPHDAKATAAQLAAYHRELIALCEDELDLRLSAASAMRFRAALYDLLAQKKSGGGDFTRPDSPAPTAPESSAPPLPAPTS